jgi:hypothetical protein
MASVRRLAAGVAGAAAFLAIAAAAAFWSVRAANDRSVQRAAAPLLGCPAARIEVRERSTGDAAEWYRVRGCGRDATLICSAPDYDCFVSP